jgi:hypothetical protein
MGIGALFLLDNRDLNLPACLCQTGVEIKLEFPFNVSWACLCRQTGLPRGSLLKFYSKEVLCLSSNKMSKGVVMNALNISFGFIIWL